MAAKGWFKEANWPIDAMCNKDTLWHALAWNGDLEMFKLVSPFLSLQNINDTDINGLTPMAIAVHRGGIVLVKHLLFLGADPDIPDDQKKTLLHHVAQYGDISWFTEVQDMGANDLLRNERGLKATDILTERMKHGTQVDLEVLRTHWEKRHFQKTMM
jgi:ankyrin repeat protein